MDKMKPNQAPIYKVYKHTFPNGKAYIGITSQPLSKRFMNGKGYKECPKMNAAILKYGWNNVEHEMLYDGLTKAEAEAKEIELIAHYNSIDNGYNIEHGGNVVGTHNIETRNKISAATKGKHKAPCTEERKAQLKEMYSGCNNPFWGKHHTEAVRSEHSEFMKGNQYNKGNHHTDTFKAIKSFQMSEKYKNGGNPRCKAVVCIDEEGNKHKFVSLRNAAESMTANVTTLYKHINNGKPYLGYTWEYAK